MKIEMRGIGILPDLCIDLDGMAVIAGINGTGKSTVLKAIYSVLGRAVDLDEITSADIRWNLLRLYTTYSKEPHRRYDEDLDYESAIEELEELIKADSPDYRRLEAIRQLVYDNDKERAYGSVIRNSIRQEFGDVEQFRRIGSDSDAYLKCIGSDTLDCVVDQRGAVRFAGSLESVPRIVYYDSPFNADMAYDYPLKSYRGYRYTDHRSMLASFLWMDRDTDIVSNDISDSNLEKFDSAVEQAIKGMFVRTDEGLRYRTRDGTELNIRNLAAGAKVFAIIRKLVDDGTISEGSILVLDEPEVHLHPQWINILAECLKILVHEMGVRVVVTTHSPQLLMAIESDTKNDGMTRFYHLTDDRTGSVSFREVTDDLQPVYEEMYIPIQDIASRFWERSDGLMAYQRRMHPAVIGAL